jgi:hypothetical protein
MTSGCFAGAKRHVLYAAKHWESFCQGILTMTEKLDFEEVLELFEKHGWELYGFWLPYRVFRDPNDPDALPWLVEVKDGKVAKEDFDKIKKVFG